MGFFNRDNKPIVGNFYKLKTPDRFLSNIRMERFVIAGEIIKVYLKEMNDKHFVLHDTLNNPGMFFVDRYLDSDNEYAALNAYILSEWEDEPESKVALVSEEPFFVPDVQDYYLQFPENAPRTLTDQVYDEMNDNEDNIKLIIQYLVGNLPRDKKVELAREFSLILAVKTETEGA